MIKSDLVLFRTTESDNIKLARYAGLISNIFDTVYAVYTTYYYKNDGDVSKEKAIALLLRIIRMKYKWIPVNIKYAVEKYVEKTTKSKLLEDAVEYLIEPAWFGQDIKSVEYDRIVVRTGKDESVTLHINESDIQSIKVSKVHLKSLISNFVSLVYEVEEPVVALH